MSYNPAAGPPQVALFSFSHASGTASTGPIGFTPKYAIYQGIVQVNNAPNGGDSYHMTGFATGTAGNARGSSSGFIEGPGAPQNPGGSAGFSNSAIAGIVSAAQNTNQFSGFGTSLSVTAFGPAGISLTWSLAVGSHGGNLLVIG